MPCEKAPDHSPQNRSTLIMSLVLKSIVWKLHAETILSFCCCAVVGLVLLLFCFFFMFLFLFCVLVLILFCPQLKTSLKKNHFWFSRLKEFHIFSTGGASETGKRLLPLTPYPALPPGKSTRLLEGLLPYVRRLGVERRETRINPWVISRYCPPRNSHIISLIKALLSRWFWFSLGGDGIC